jgi:acyl carrier protein
MNEESILRAMTDIFRDVLDVPDLVLRRGTTGKDVEEWDSLTHIQLVAAIERRFKIRFAASEIEGFQNVGDMADAIAKKLSS